jgi:hypothetical protein
MTLKTLSQLSLEIDEAVHSPDTSSLGKTTAVALNALLKSLAQELTILPQQAALTAARKADLDAAGRVLSSQLPSYVDDVLEAPSLATLPQSGETGKIYVTLDTNLSYRWSGSQYVEISKAPTLYTTLGPNVDGPMSQKAVTDAVAGIVDQAANKAVLVRADRSKIYYTGNGTAAAANADDAVVRAFAAAAPGDYVYLTAPVDMPNAGYYATLCVVKGGTNVNLGGYPITSINRQDCLGISTGGTGIVYGYGSLLTAVGPGSYGVNIPPAATTADYRLLNVNCRATGPAGGLLLRAGTFYQEGRIEVLGYGSGVIINNGSRHELVGDITVAGAAGSGFLLTHASRFKLRNGRLDVRHPNALAGSLYDSAELELERAVLDLTAAPGGGIVCRSAGARVTLTDTTVLGGSLVATAMAGTTVVLRGNTTLPAAYEADYLRGLGLTVLDERPVRGVAHRTGTELTFEQDAEYEPVNEGTFTLDDRGKRIGAVVVAYLGPDAKAPEIPGGFQSRDVYEPGKSLMYMFKVGANGSIQYTITELTPGA